MNERSKESILAVGHIATDTESGQQDLESCIGRWLQQMEQAKWPRGLQYFENASLLLGNHLTRFYYTADGFGFHHFGLHDNSQFDNLVAKSADNRLIRPVETMVSMLVQTQPNGRVVPNSELPEDEDAADLAQISLDLVWEKPLDMGKKLHDAGMVGAICGTVAIEVEYGETNIPVVIAPQEEQVQVGEDDEGYPEFETRMTKERVEYRKDIQARVWTPFHMTPDPAATCAEDMSWIARTSFEDIDWIKENFDVEDDDRYFPKNLEHIMLDNASQHILYWWSKVQDIIESPQSQHGGGLTAQTFTTHGGYAPNQTIFTVADVKPTKDFPKGRTLILAGGKLIYAGDARSWSEEYPDRWHPYAFWSWFRIPGRFWGVPLLSEIVPLQKKINAIDALVHVNRQFMSIGQWKLPKHSKVRDGGTSGIPGGNLRFTAVPGMSDPEKVQHVSLPAELLVEREDLIKAIDLIAASGTTDAQVSKSAARAGVMLNFLREEKLRSKSPMIQEYERMLETVCQNVLIELQLNLRDEDPVLTQRIQAATRDHSSLAIQSFTGASLRDHHTVKLDVASALLKSPEAKEAKAIELAQYLGASMTPSERRGIFQVVGLDEYLQNEENASVERARRMVSRIVAGEADAAFAIPGENAAAVLNVLQLAVLDDKYNDYDPDAKKLIMDLRDEYAEMVAKEKQNQLELRIALAQAGVKQ